MNISWAYNESWRVQLGWWLLCSGLLVVRTEASLLPSCRMENAAAAWSPSIWTTVWRSLRSSKCAVLASLAAVMAVVKPLLARLSTPASPTPPEDAARVVQATSGRTYDVFISHAGQQKKGFAVWLQRELRRHGISSFLDERSLRLGDEADLEMEAALRSCSIVITVLTPDFLRSSYCMQELHWALHPQQPHPPLQQKYAEVDAADSGVPAQQQQWQQQCVQRSSKPPILMPVFYGTSDLSMLQRQLQQHISGYEGSINTQRLETFQADMQADKEAVLRRVGDRLDSHGIGDDLHVDAIVTEVLRWLGQPRVQAADHPVDLEERIQALLPLLQPDQPGGVRVLSLHGMGGIGKTTLARALFNELGSGKLSFGQRVFLEVCQAAVETDALRAKQQELISMLTSDGAGVPAAGSLAEQQEQLRNCTRQGGALLLVLDDLWSAQQRDALLHLDALPEGSRVVLTGRDSGDLHQDGSNCALRPVALLEEQQALQLLCWHAFAGDSVPAGMGRVVQTALGICSGLPLALRVLGSALRSQPPDACEDELKDLLRDQLSPLATVLPVLKWSLDRLPTDGHRQMFLDAALLLRGQPVEHLAMTWAALLQEPRRPGRRAVASPTALHRRANEMIVALECASLISFDIESDGRRRLQVHDCLVEMALAVLEHGEQPGGWSLSDMVANEPLPKEGDTSVLASRLRCGPGSSSTWTLAQLLSRHPRCRLVALDMEELLPNDGSVAASQAIPDLRYLRLAAPPHQLAFGEQLVVLDLSTCRQRLKQLPDSIGSLNSLQHLDLGDCYALQQLPDSIGGLSSLQHLDLGGCDVLQQLPDSIGGLSSLQHLDLGGCNALQHLPDSISGLSSLQHLNLSYCIALQQLPDSIGGLSRLQHLDLSYCNALQQLPDSIGGLSSLQHLDMRYCNALQQLPDSIGGLSSLQHLDLGGCDALQHLPDSISGLSSLQHLDLGDCIALQQLPDSIGGLSSLQHLNLKYCSTLQQLADSIGGLSSLQRLNLRFCRALQQLPDSFGGLSSLQHLNLSYCNALQQLPDSIGGLSSLQDLNLGDCIALQQLPDSIGGLSSLQHLNLDSCRALQQLPHSVGGLSSLQRLDLGDCEALQQLPDSVGGLSSLQRLNLWSCIALQQLPDSIGGLSSLQHLDLDSCRALQQLPGSIGGLSSLQHLNLKYCSTLQQLADSIGGLSSLQRLDLGGCDALQQLADSFGGLSSLQHLDMRYCNALQQLPDSIGGLSSLQHLNLKYCSTLQQLADSIGGLSSLQHLDLGGCDALQHLPDSISGLSSLQHLDLGCCIALQQLPDSIGGLSSLQHLNLKYCSTLQQLADSIGGLSSLQRLNLRYCRALQQLPDSFGGLSSLQYLDVSYCDALQQLPDSVGGLSRLQHLDLRGCDALQQLPDSIGGLSSLQHLNLGGCIALQQLPDSVGGLSSLQHLNLGGCRALQQLPDSIGGLSSLQHLSLWGCDALQQLPDSIGGLSRLQHLDLSVCRALQQLPESIRSLSSLLLELPAHLAVL